VKPPRRPSSILAPGLPGVRVYTPDEAKEIMNSKWCCEHCEALHAVKKRAFNNSFVVQLSALYRYFQRPAIYSNLQFHLDDTSGHWVHGAHYLLHSGLHPECSKLRFWGLIELHGGTKEDGNPRNGYLRITARGKFFCDRRFKIYPHILTRNQQGGHVGYVDGELVGIVDAGGIGFNYNKEIRGWT